jgi:hypothetical protein
MHERTARSERKDAAGRARRVRPRERQPDPALALASTIGNRGFAYVARSRAPATPPARATIQRAVSLEWNFKPDPTTMVYIRDIGRPPIPRDSMLKGPGGVVAARHIISWAMLKRELMASFSRRTVADLKETFPGVKRDKDYTTNLAKAMWKVVLWEDAQLNRGKGKKKRPEGALSDADRYALPALGAHAEHTQTRNYWRGNAAANTAKEKLSDTLRQASDQKWKKTFPKVGTDSESIKKISSTKKFLDFQAEAQDLNLKWMAEEFDPPPGASKAQIQAQAKEWARVTNAWLDADLKARAYYWPGRDVESTDAYHPKYSPANATVYKAAY